MREPRQVWLVGQACKTLILDGIDRFRTQLAFAVQTCRFIMPSRLQFFVQIVAVVLLLCGVVNETRQAAWRKAARQHVISVHSIWTFETASISYCLGQNYKLRIKCF